MNRRPSGFSPAEIYRELAQSANETVSGEFRDNLEIILDLHWIFLHSRRYKAEAGANFRRHVGKWKYDAASTEELLEKAKTILPYIAGNTFPVVKFTNVGNVFSGERQIVVYCCPGSTTGKEIGNILKGSLNIPFYWGSYRYKEPE